MKYEILGHGVRPLGRMKDGTQKLKVSITVDASGEVGELMTSRDFVMALVNHVTVNGELPQYSSIEEF